MVINSSSEAAHNDTLGEENSKNVSKGGYDYAYVSQVLECLCCALCLLPARDAVETNCGHMCCLECLQVWLQTPSIEPACPVCRTELSPNDIRPSLFLQRQILNLQVRCDRKPEPENDVDGEGNNSLFAPIQRQILKSQVQRDRESKPENDVDGERNNSLSATRQAQMDDTSKESSNANPKAHDKFSSSGTTESSLTSCSESMTIGEMLIHEGTCSFARVMCPAGCGHRFVRANINDHLQEKAGSHIRTLYEHNKKLYERNNKLLIEMRKIIDDTCLGAVGFIVSKPAIFSSCSSLVELENDPCESDICTVPRTRRPTTITRQVSAEKLESRMDSNYVVPRNVQTLMIPSTYKQTDCLDVFPKLFRLQKMTDMYICCTLEEAVLDIPRVPYVRVLKTDDLVWSGSVLCSIGRAFPALEVLVVERVIVRNVKYFVDRGSFASLQKLQYCKLGSFKAYWLM
eukprot:CFRG7026T1